MDIFGVMYSPFTARVVLAARHKGIKHKLSMPKDGTKTPAYLKLNPLGKAPVMKDGATVLFESGVIVEYLDAKYKKKRIVPTNPKAMAQARLIAALFAEYVQPHIFALWGQADPAKRDQALVDGKLAEINKGLDIIEGRLKAAPYAAGDKFTIADCYAVPVLFWLDALLTPVGVADPLGGRKKLKKYAAKVRKDKLIGGVLAEMAEGLKQMQNR